MGIEQTEFRSLLGHFASGVTVITTRQQNQLYGATVSSFCSLSLQPPLVLVCLCHQAAMHDLTRETGVFGINILAAHNEHLSRHFACHMLDKFANMPHTLGQLGVPLLDEALATLECRLTACYPGGDHSIFIGEVVSAQIQPQRQPLLYFRGQYGQLCGQASHITGHHRSVESVVCETVTV
jgi:flavin reductase (DIM6/NTAB) family NADH-FMN oxidoreductase RutF